MDTLAAVFSPPLLAVFAIVSLGFGGILFLLARRTESVALELTVPLSWSEPVELRLILYLILGAICATAALVLRLLFGFTGGGGVFGWLLLLLTAIGFVFNLAFFYAAIGSLLQGALGTRGRPPFWFFRLLSPVDGLIMDVGDMLARVLFRAAPGEEWVRSRRRHDYDEYDYGYDRPPRARSFRGRRVHYVDDDEYEFDRPSPRRREPAPHMDEPDRVPPRRREPETYADEPDFIPPRGRERAPYAEGPERTPRRPVFEEDVDAGYADEYEPPRDVAAQRRRGRRSRGRTQEDILRERLEMAIREYEMTLTPSQREKLQEMRTIFESIKQV